MRGWTGMPYRTSARLGLRKQSTVTAAPFGPAVATTTPSGNTTANTTSSPRAPATATVTTTRHTNDSPSLVPPRPLPPRRAPSSSSQSPQLHPPTPPDPYAFVKSDLTYIRSSLLGLLGSSNPTLTQVAEYYFRHPSKQIRPLIVLLFARACNGLGLDWGIKQGHAESEGAGGRSDELDMPLSRPDVLNDWNPSMPDYTSSFEDAFLLRVPTTAKYRRNSFSPPTKPRHDILPFLSETILPTQRRLAQIVEMIHVASLLHDDVLDDSPLRRGAPSAPAMFGNKMSVLAGDFLLARASIALSRLGDNEVVELISAVIANLVEGEILQIGTGAGKSTGDSQQENAGTDGELVSTVLNRMQSEPKVSPAGLVKPETEYITPQDWRIYLQKSYFKTASLMAKGVRASVILGGAREGEMWKEVAYAYGRNVGIAFQVRWYFFPSAHAR